MCNTSKLLLGLVLASSLSVASAKQKIIALQSLGIRANQATNTAPTIVLLYYLPQALITLKP